MPQVTGPTNLRQSQGQNVLGRTQWASVEARVAAKIGSDLADLPKDRHPARAALLTVVKQQLARERGTQEDRHAGKRAQKVLDRAIAFAAFSRAGFQVPSPNSGQPSSEEVARSSTQATFGRYYRLTPKELLSADWENRKVILWGVFNEGDQDNTKGGGPV